MQYLSDIGLYHIDRARASCRHKTSFCRTHCYMRKFYARAGESVFATWQRRLKDEWQALTPETFGRLLERRKHPTRRFRFATQGEAFSSLDDVAKVSSIIRAFPEILFWVPTRAWRSPEHRARIEREAMTLPNARIMASLDPSNTEAEFRGLVSHGWSMTFFGIDDIDTQPDFFAGWAQGRFRCPKTWQGREGHCATCRGGCFTPQVHVHMREH